MFLSFIIFLNIIISVAYGNLPSKFYGGKRISINKIPHQVSIQYENTHMCGGSIISDKHILTAASCVTSEINVFYGNLKISTGRDDSTRENKYRFSTIFYVNKVVLYENYNPHQNWMNDIAILVLESPMKMIFRFREAVSMPPKRIFAVNNCYTTGWGLNPMTNMISKHLQKIDVKIIASSRCQRDYFKTYLDLFYTQHCFIPLLATTGLTLGSGGSPVMFHRKIIGVISVDSLDINLPVIYTHVWEYIDWIQEKCDLY